MKYLVNLLAILSCSVLTGQNLSPVGTWGVFQEETGEIKAHVEIFEKNAKYHGRIVKLFDERPDAVCQKCDKARRGKPIVGLIVIKGLRKFGQKWKKGTLLNPASGKVYRCSMWFEGKNKDRLRVRGKHWTGLYKTQTWRRL